jgi:hypothetical protein
MIASAQVKAIYETGERMEKEEDNAQPNIFARLQPQDWQVDWLLRQYQSYWGDGHQ